MPLHFPPTVTFHTTVMHFPPFGMHFPPTRGDLVCCSCNFVAENIVRDASPVTHRTQPSPTHACTDHRAVTVTRHRGSAGTPRASRGCGRGRGGPGTRMSICAGGGWVNYAVHAIQNAQNQANRNVETSRSRRGHLESGPARSARVLAAASTCPCSLRDHSNAPLDVGSRAP